MQVDDSGLVKSLELDDHEARPQRFAGFVEGSCISHIAQLRSTSKTLPQEQLFHTGHTQALHVKNSPSLTASV